MRTYEETHPWIKFDLDLRRVSYKTWLLLGQVIANLNHIAGMPVKPQLADHLMQTFLIKGALATTAIEGNTLTEEEVQKRLDGKLDLPPSKEYLGHEIDNILDAYNQVTRRTLSAQDTTICVDELRKYNSLILEGLPLSGAEVVPGEIRKHQVGVGRYRGAPPDDLEWLLERFCTWLNLYGLYSPPLAA
jgi:Fic family protein